MKWNESGFRPPLCTYRLNWARRTSWRWWDDWDDTVLQTQDSKFEPWRSEAEHATSRSRRLPTILTFTRGWGRNIFVSFKPSRPGTEPRTLAWKAAVLTTTLGPPHKAGVSQCGTSSQSVDYATCLAAKCFLLVYWCNMPCLSHIMGPDVMWDVQQWSHNAWCLVVWWWRTLSIVQFIAQCNVNLPQSTMQFNHHKAQWTGPQRRIPCTTTYNVM